MRIISGAFKGRRIHPPKNLPVRPTTDMSKEALFNVLNNHFHFQDLKVLDLFAGTGNISYEFASRGCEDITCVDGDFGCVKFIKQTAAEFDFHISAIKSDVFKFIEKCGVQYDLIFADPPYDLSQEVFENLVKDIFKYQLLTQDGMLIIEHSKHTHLEHLLHHSEGRNYGGSVFSFFEIQSESDE
ncbi:RsmD family RNA methyltransferase [Flavobacterium sp. CYK-55]|uniref:RsmD family RNA methyltransferase n=1 Tax=Flavobacterium sp. CYK-55 TaxID=2835529 RepID=UPI001BD0BBBE|nr:RsmD family RNA methyltransferase [Flavobacterium sp. CYK-55]MBS7786580.1 RsmD family RNA methyltransferase [Flavobacterium sp. CYK-55]